MRSIIASIVLVLFASCILGPLLHFLGTDKNDVKILFEPGGFSQTSAVTDLRALVPVV